MPEIPYFQLLKCDNLLPFTVLYLWKLKNFGALGQKNKQFNDILAIFTIFHTINRSFDQLRK